VFNVYHHDVSPIPHTIRNKNVLKIVIIKAC